VLDEVQAKDRVQAVHKLEVRSLSQWQALGPQMFVSAGCHIWEPGRMN
jgi:hypothetical protein